MGGKPSKRVEAVNAARVQNLNLNKSEPNACDEYDEIAIQKLKYNLRKNPNEFIINMLLMSYVFFENYSEEMKHLATVRSKRIQKFNVQLLKSNKKQLLSPDVLMKKISSRVTLQLPNAEESESLMPQRMFIIDESVKVLENDDTHISDKSLHCAKIEQWGKTEPGFVQVQLLFDTFNTKKSSSGNLYESTEPREKNNNSIGSVRDDSGVSTTFSSDSEHGSYETTKSSTSNNPETLEKNIYTHYSQLPSTCITVVEVKKVLNEDEENTKTDSEIADQSTFITQHYLNSQQFMHHFKNKTFPYCIAESLGFLKSSLLEATSIPGAIFCSKEDAKNKCCCYEIVPSVAIPWPEELAFEWKLRHLTEDVVWPTKKMMKEVADFQAIIVPKGFVPKLGKNLFENIEWEVLFPKGEQYLELRMSHPQMRTYLFLIILFKVLIEPTTKRSGLLVEHIRTLMFWECQMNYNLWPEDQLGTKLTTILEKLYEHLEMEHLPHYFIKSRNVFNNIPSRYLKYAQNVINDILEAPAIHVLFALTKLNYTKANWYPAPDLDKLYKIFTTNSLIEIQTENDVDTNSDDAINKNRKSDTNCMTAPKNLKNDKVEIDLKVSLKPFDLVRSALLLTFFIQHFLQIVNHPTSPVPMKLFYLKQCYYLSKLLEESDKENAKTYQNQIKKLENNLSSEIEVVEVSPPTSVLKRNIHGRMFRTTDLLQPTTLHSNYFETKRKLNSRLHRYDIRETVTIVDIHTSTRLSENKEEETSKSVSFKS